MSTHSILPGRLATLLSYLAYYASPNCSSPIRSRPGPLNHRRHLRSYPGFGVPLGTEPARHGLPLLNFATPAAECYPESVSDVQPAAHIPRGQQNYEKHCQGMKCRGQYLRMLIAEDVATLLFVAPKTFHRQ